MFEPCENLSRHALMLSLKSGIAAAMRAGREASVMPCMENHCQPQPRSLGWGDQTMTIHASGIADANCWPSGTKPFG